jgi:predicted O-methyltransferase YrrM
VALTPDDRGVSERDRIHELADENARLREQLGSVLESSSWRLTRPLRRLRGSARPEVVPLPAKPGPIARDSTPEPPVAEPEPEVPVRFPAGHYYSPLVDPAELLLEPRHSQIWPAEPRATPGVDWREPEQIALCREVFARQERLIFPDEAGDDASEFHAQNGQYPPLDAWLLEAMLRWLRPRRMIEIGSGFSSLLTARVNRELLGRSMHFTCIEPYPREFLTAGVDGISDLIVAKVQDVPLETFAGLGSGDVLFIDTSHTVKTGGDVTWIFHEIVPRLAPGVVVHVHDAFLPGDYPQAWVLEGWGWNETYLLQSFLAFNSAFEILVGAQYMSLIRPDVVAEAFPSWPTAPDRGGAALWFRRRA